jgi:hypothetical protein
VDGGRRRGAPGADRNEALGRHLAARPDIKVFYDENWGADKYDPREAVRTWLYISGEGKDKSPVQYAIEKGLVKLPALAQRARRHPLWHANSGEPRRRASEADRGFAREQWEASEKRAKESRDYRI